MMTPHPHFRWLTYSRNLLLGILGASLAFTAACHVGPQNSDSHHDHSGHGELDTLRQGMISCASRKDTGYTRGKAFSIEVVTVDGKAVERNTANAYWVMREAARKAGVNIVIVSGFRTMAQQQYLYNCYLSKRCNNGNLAARPGYSNHQSGHALDLNTSNGSVYSWLSRNGANYGFKRTVPSEKWHWEWWSGGPGGGPCQSGCKPACVSGSKIRDKNCGVGDCAAFGARCTNDRLGVRCTSVLCPALGTKKSCNKHQVVTCKDGKVSLGNCAAFGTTCTTKDTGIARCQKVCKPTCLSGTKIRSYDCGEGDCAAFGAKCTDDKLGVRCYSAFCPPIGTKKFCYKGQLGTCKDGKVTFGDCSKFGATCSTEGPGGARCVFSLCPASGTKKFCDKGKLVTCVNGAVSFGDCSVFGAVCANISSTDARCHFSACPATGTKKFCDKDNLVACKEGAVSFEDCGKSGTKCVAKGTDDAACSSGCTPGCISDTKIRGADCGIGDCAAYGAKCIDDQQGTRCYFALCPPTGLSTFCHEGKIATCQDGQVSFAECPADKPCAGIDAPKCTPVDPDSNPHQPQDGGADEPGVDAGQIDAGTPDAAGTSDTPGTADTAGTSKPDNSGAGEITKLDPIADKPEPPPKAGCNAGCNIGQSAEQQPPLGGLALLFLLLLAARPRKDPRR